MKRSFNYTDRQEIERGDIDLRVAPGPDGSPLFWISLVLDEYELPSDATVWLEASTKLLEFQRWSLGTVGELRLPEDRRLTAFSGTAPVTFRVKVVGTGAKSGLLLAERDHLFASEPGDSTSGALPLLSLKSADIGQLVWDLDLTGEIPCLVINTNAGDRYSVSAEARFRALVMPVVIRQILTEAVLEDPPPDDSDDWRRLWIRYVEQIPGVSKLEPDDDEEDRRKWINEAVDRVASHREYLNRYLRDIRDLDEVRQ